MRTKSKHFGHLPLQTRERLTNFLFFKFSRKVCKGNEKCLYVLNKKENQNFWFESLKENVFGFPRWRAKENFRLVDFINRKRLTDSLFYWSARALTKHLLGQQSPWKWRNSKVYGDDIIAQANWLDREAESERARFFVFFFFLCLSDRPWPSYPSRTSRPPTVMAGGHAITEERTEHFLLHCITRICKQTPPCADQEFEVLKEFQVFKMHFCVFEMDNFVYFWRIMSIGRRIDTFGWKEGTSARKTPNNDRRFIRFTKNCECDDHNMNTLQMYMDINSKSNALALHRRITLTIHSRNTKASSMFHHV